MDIKEYLIQAYDLDQRLEAQKERMTEMRSLKGHVSSPSYGGGVQTSVKADPVGVILVLEEDCLKEITRLLKLKYEIQKIFDCIEDSIERTIIEKRYLHRKNWDTISNEIRYAKSHIFKIHGRALNKIRKKIVNDSK